MSSVSSEGNDLNVLENQQRQQEIYKQKRILVQTKSSPSKLISKRNTKREQVKCACVNCKKSCKKCDDERPCQRCIRLNIAETCKDSIRKERKLVPSEESNLNNTLENQQQQQVLSKEKNLQVQLQRSLTWPTAEKTTKREQVKCACVNCQKSRKKCDDKRPCQRCIDLNITETCKDSIRKARKSIKREISIIRILKFVY
ncbi:Zn(2)-C6 fungal-specific transcription factor [Rhizophagus clarus]|uniref:Zn(2)-C6 fungal-specific transcription factor n=1 Tax=Rhizophagus clarus TaxID=94130 RepID=A0A8H3QUM6_9GLOM|nr:Zn(2)-C6 fungal-specific transcription factor [Rhizophagus clarus]